MNPPLHHTSALASAIRSRLSEGGEVLLTGVGMLQRVHEPASVETRDDGQKVLLPPKEAIQFTANKSLSGQFDEALVSAFTASVEDDIETPRDAIDDILVKLRKKLEKNGEFVFEDVGIFATDEGKVAFQPAEVLTNLVNKPFAGLPQIAPREERVEQDVFTKLIDEPTDKVAADVSDESDAIESVADAKGESDVNEPAADTETEPVAVEFVDVDEDLIVPVPTVLDQLANKSKGELEEVPPTEIARDEVTIDEDIDALLDSVWAPVATASGDINYDPHSGITDLQEQAEISESLALEEDDDVDLVAVGAAETTLSTSKELPVWRAADRKAETKEYSGIRALLVPSLIVLCVLAVVAIWPNSSGDNNAELTNADSADGAASNDASADPLYATHAGGRADVDDAEGEDLSTFESDQLLRDGDESSVEAVPEAAAERARQAAATQAPAPTSPPAAREEPTPRPTRSELPSQLRGPGAVAPAPGGATWILASGNRTSAEELAARYRSQGYRSSVLAGEANGIAVFRVAVGQFASAAEARSLRSRLPPDAPSSTWVLRF